jgi:hypothetical protein
LKLENEKKLNERILKEKNIREKLLREKWEEEKKLTEKIKKEQKKREEMMTNRLTREKILMEQLMMNQLNLEKRILLNQMIQKHNLLSQKFITQNTMEKNWKNRNYGLLGKRENFEDEETEKNPFKQEELSQESIEQAEIPENWEDCSDHDNLINIRLIKDKLYVDDVLSKRLRKLAYFPKELKLRVGKLVRYIKQKRVQKIQRKILAEEKLSAKEVRKLRGKSGKLELKADYLYSTLGGMVDMIEKRLESSLKRLKVQEAAIDFDELESAKISGNDTSV